MSGVVHLIKLSVGSEDIEDLRAWQASARAQGSDGLPRHVTRMWPKRSAEVLNGGSIYWVIKGMLKCRQRILRLDEVIGSDGVRRCAIVLEPKLVAVRSAPRRAFQGWRYLSAHDAPADLSDQRAAEAPIPSELDRILTDIGVI